MKYLMWLLALALFACGGPKPNTPSNTSVDVDQDPLVLLPPGALGILSLDAKALFADETLGKPTMDLVDKLVPLGQESGFEPSKNVDRVIVGSYALEGVDFSGVISGTFDLEKISAAAKNHSVTKGGGQINESTYAEHSVYTVANVGFSLVSTKTALIGTEAGIRRALDRLKSGKLTRDLQPWMYETLETKGAAFALAADLTSQNIAAMSLGPLNLSFLKGLKVVRVVGNFGKGTIQVAGTATFAEPAQASTGAEGFRQVAKMIGPFAALGVIPQLQDLKIEPKEADVQVTFTVQSKQLADVLSKLPQYL